jgi:hypothetical protein
MSKDEGVRITDTINFIRTAAVPAAHNAKRATVADLLRDYDADGHIADTVSPAMSQGSNYAILGRDEVKENRHYRRAIILIRMALQNADRSVAPRDVSQIGDANLPNELGNSLGQIHATLHDLTTKLALLKSNPISFLSNNTFNMVSAGATAPSGVADYVFYYDTLNSQYNLAPEATVKNWAAVSIEVFHLHVQPYAGLARTQGPNGQSLDVVGNAAYGADLMVTTQLTGCSIVYYLNGATLVAAHVQPTGGIDAETMCTNLRADATLSNAPGLAVTGVFGAQAPKGVDPNNYQKAGNFNFCIGVRIGGTWNLCAQQRTRGVGGAKVAWTIAHG